MGKTSQLSGWESWSIHMYSATNPENASASRRFAVAVTITVYRTLSANSRTA